MAISIAVSTLALVVNQIKVNPGGLPEFRSKGMKELTISHARQNMPSNSVLDVSSGRLNTNREKDLSLRFCRWAGKGSMPSDGFLLTSIFLLFWFNSAEEDKTVQFSQMTRTKQSCGNFNPLYTTGHCTKQSCGNSYLCGGRYVDRRCGTQLAIVLHRSYPKGGDPKNSNRPKVNS